MHAARDYTCVPEQINTVLTSNFIADVYCINQIEFYIVDLVSKHSLEREVQLFWEIY